MNRTLVILIMLIAGVLGVRADLLTDILIDKKYDAQLMTTEQQDSILNGAEQAQNSVIGGYLSQRAELIESHKQLMFRYSYWADYTLYDPQKKDTIVVGDSLREVSFSPDRRYLVYGKGQDLYIYKIDFGTEIAISHDYEDGKDIFSGLSDWLYEEEFERTQLYWFSPDSKQVAFIRLDETDVPNFEWQTFLPINGEKSGESSYPSLRSIRYPKAGYPNAKASVCVYDIQNKTIKILKIGDTEDWYIPTLVWRTIPAANKKEAPSYELIVEKINRDQTKQELWSVNPKSAVGKLFYQESSDKYYIDYALFEQWQWLSDGRIIALSEKEGWRQVWLMSKDGLQMKALTPATMDVTAIYGVDEKAGYIYYQAAPVPSERQAYAVSLKGETPIRLTTEEGFHSLRFGKDWSRFIDCYQSEAVAPRYALYNIKKGQVKGGSVVFDNDAITQAWAASEIPVKTFTTIPTERGDTLEAWVIYPKNFDESQLYPVAMFQYSGPASQTVLNRWRHRFGHVLAAMGYIVVNADVRGSECRGRQWRNETYMELGQKEAEDHLSVAQYIAALPYVDSEQITMIGWSYGGYQTIRTMMEQKADKPIISRGVAIAPVTDWRLYDSGYTERYMRRPQVNEYGYRAANLIPRARDLQGKLLIVHGTGDDNVHYQNTLLLIDALVQAGKQFDMQLYIDDNHSMRKAANYEHLHRKIINFINN